jgi:hypothetical protein
MLCDFVLFLLIFLLGEILVNVTLFRYIRHYFHDIPANTTGKKIFGFNISVFKGLLERFLLYLGLCNGFTPILIVFGAIKLGTRLSPQQQVQNDYFLIGNFLSILVSILYTIGFQILQKPFCALF